MVWNRMVQTFDFMSKNFKHVLIQKVTFSTKKEPLTQSYTRKPCVNTQKPVCTPIKQCCQYLQTNFLEYTETFQCPHSASHLQQPSLDWLNYLVYSMIFLCQHRVFLCQLVSRICFSWDFLDKNMFTSIILLIWWCFLEHLSIDYVQNRSGYVI